jgi:hypothetical protein
MNAILEDKKGILQTHSLRWLIYLWDCLGRNLFVGEILYGIESILSRLLLYLTFLGPEDYWCSWSFLLETPLDFIVFLDTPHSWCKTKKKQTNQINYDYNGRFGIILITMEGLILFWIQGENLDSSIYDNSYGGGDFSHAYVIMHQYFDKNLKMQKMDTSIFINNLTYFHALLFFTHVTCIWGHK